MRRCLTTCAPPWLFPCSNSGIALDHAFVPNHAVGSTSSGSHCQGANGMRMAVFVADPRYLVMKEVQAMRVFGQSYRGEEPLDIRAFLELHEQEHLGILPGLAGGAMNSGLAWAEVEARCPDRVRLFFIDDFLSDPEVAMASLARFLDVPASSDATQRVVRESPRFADIHHYTPSGAGAGCIQELVKVDGLADLVNDFECFMANAPDLRLVWERQLGRWLQSPNPRMVAWASGAMQREPWNPERWWAVHSARVCRPCLFFPRGKCSDDDCIYCHGQHRKPKRPSKSIRNRRQGRNREQTPSPERAWEAVSPPCLNQFGAIGVNGSDNRGTYNSGTYAIDKDGPDNHGTYNSGTYTNGIYANGISGVPDNHGTYNSGTYTNGVYANGISGVHTNGMYLNAAYAAPMPIILVSYQ